MLSQYTYKIIITIIVRHKSPCCVKVSPRKLHLCMFNTKPICISPTMHRFFETVLVIHSTSHLAIHSSPFFQHTFHLHYVQQFSVHTSMYCLQFIVLFQLVASIFSDIIIHTPVLIECTNRMFSFSHRGNLFEIIFFSFPNALHPDLILCVIL